MNPNQALPGMVQQQSWGAMQGVNPMQQFQSVMQNTVNPMQSAISGAVKIPPLSLVNPQNNQPAQIQMSPPQHAQQSPRQQPNDGQGQLQLGGGMMGQMMAS